MLKQRVITALILAAGFLLLLAQSAAVMAIGFAFIVAIAAWEWAGLSAQTRILRLAYAVAVLFVCAVLAWCFAGDAGLTASWVGNWLAAATTGWAVILLWVTTYPASSRFWGSVAVRLLLGILVLASVYVALLYLCYHQYSVWLIFYLVALVAVADIGAYFSGRAFGKHKLAIMVSPGKTWEGFFGGMLAVAAFSLVVQTFFALPGISLPVAMVVSMLCAGTSVLGDLFESMLKRHAGIKDSSQLLPGHGGVLDRVDGIIAAAPVFAMALLALGAAV